ncbi:MAG: hypothetical protein Q7N87_01955 [Candidatus Uhrbacteria bacterium]|nr:hypothetical protein [Candidatus Uhrbacteria bacterium]
MKVELVLNKKQQTLFTKRAAREGVQPHEYARRLLMAYANDQGLVLPVPVFPLTKKIKRSLELALKSYKNGTSIRIASFRELFSIR